MSKQKQIPNTISPMLFLGIQMETGGAQKILLEQATWFHNKGQKVFVVFIYDKQGIHREWENKFNFPIINLNAWNAKSIFAINIIRLFWGSLKILNLIYLQRIKLIQTFTNDGNLIGLPLARLMKVPIRIGNHQGVIARRPLWLGKLQAFLLKTNIASHLIVVSQDLQEYVINNDGVKKNLTSIIHNGYSLKINPNAYRSKFADEAGIGAEKTLYCLTVGRLAPQKGHEILISAIPKVIDAHPEVEFIFVGDGELRERLMTQAKILGVRDHIRFLGVRQDVHDLMGFSDILIVPSFWEGFSLAMLESMAIGLPIIGSDVVGIKEMLGNNTRGRLVPPKNHEALAKAIIDLIEDPDARNRFSKLGKDYVQDGFSMEAMCQKYEEFFINYLHRS